MLVAAVVFALGCVTNCTNNRWSIAESAADAANAAVVAAHLIAAITSSERSAAHDRGNVVFGVPKPPSNGLSADHWALITALTPP